MMEFKKPASKLQPNPNAKPGSARPPQRITKSQLIKIIQEAQKSKNAKYRRIALVVLVLLLGFFIFNYIQTRDELNKAANPEKAAQEQAADLSSEVGKYLELPTDETPTVATVSDVEKLKDQVFFNNAQNGDKVLIYSKSGKAVLYRPSSKKVIEFTRISQPSSPNTNQ